METRGLKATIENIAYSADIIRGGGLVAFPTETVYGLGANGLNPKAIEKIYQAKGRPADNPMIYHVSSPLQLESLARVITREIEALVVAFWPGPLTLVVKKTSLVPYIATGGLDTVAVRMPNHPLALELIERAQCPIVAPSANLSGRPSPTRYQDVWEDMGGRIDVILEGDDCQVGIESTVVDMTIPGQITVLRPGAISPKDIKSALEAVNIDDVKVLWERENNQQRASGENPEISGSEKNLDSQETPKSPGMKYRHYAPRGEMIIVEGDRENVRDKIQELKKKGELETNDKGQGKRVAILFLEDMDPQELAHSFFSRLRELDRQGVDLILAGAINQEEDGAGIGGALMNRMLKAAGHQVIKV